MGNVLIDNDYIYIPLSMQDTIFCFVEIQSLQMDMNLLEKFVSTFLFLH